MAFVKLGDFSGSIEVVLFPKIYADVKQLFSGEKCLYIEGKASNKNDVISVLADKVKEI